ncbi:MAG: sulfotransferase [Planctomycetaceae bacterium]
MRRLLPAASAFSGAPAFIHYVWQIDAPIPWRQLRFIGDNTPLYVLSIPWLLELFPDAMFVHVVRDPRDVVCSVMSMRFGADNSIVAAMEWQQALDAG